MKQRIQKLFPTARAVGRCHFNSLAGLSRRFFPLVAAGILAAFSTTVPAQTNPTLDKILQVQPIIVSNDDGSQTARAFGGEPGSASYEFIVGIIKQVWAQAGIHIIVLPAKPWTNTFANFGDPCTYEGHTGAGTPGDPCTGGTRPFSDIDLILQAAETAGIASAGRHDTVLDAYFVRHAPGQSSPTATGGYGALPNNSYLMYIGDDEWFATEGDQTTIGTIIAHEVGHNLKLEHTDDDPNILACPPYNLMLSGECPDTVPRGLQLLPSQIAIARTNSLLPVPSLVAVRNGANLNLSWPAAHIGWRLLAQTNNLAAGISANTNDWTTVTGSATTNQLNISIDPAKATTFYRLAFP